MSDWYLYEFFLLAAVECSHLVVMLLHILYTNGPEWKFMMSVSRGRVIIMNLLSYVVFLVIVLNSCISSDSYFPLKMSLSSACSHQSMLRIVVVRNTSLHAFVCIWAILYSCAFVVLKVYVSSYKFTVTPL
jgi:hypothetical protein